MDYIGVSNKGQLTNIKRAVVIQGKGDLRQAFPGRNSISMQSITAQFLVLL